VLAVIGVDLAILIGGFVLSPMQVVELGPHLLAWTAAAAVVGLAAIQTPAGPQLGMDMPVLLAAGYLLGPLPAGLIAFAGYVDLREFRGQIGIERALFNRSQTSLSVMAATGVFVLLGGSTNIVPGAAIAALVAVGIDCVVNFGLVAGVISLHDGVPPGLSLSRLRLGSVFAFSMTYGCFGLLSLLLSEVYGVLGAWGLLLFVIPLVLARQALASAEQLETTKKRLVLQSSELSKATDRVADERRDERLSVAAGLHDDVLPPILKVHLLGQVLRQELASGQLLALEEDLPALIEATDIASDTVRGQIRSLRDSALGTQGLAKTLQLLLRQLELESASTFVAEIEDVSATPVVELLAYQAGREALRNAIHHADASSIRVVLAADDDTMRLVVEDDGQGFVPYLVNESKHHGLALMRERIGLAGGALQIETAVGSGTRITIRLPLTDPIQT
jgi:signal transduction histidine kinase